MGSKLHLGTSFEVQINVVLQNQLEFDFKNLPPNIIYKPSGISLSKGELGRLRIRLRSVKFYVNRCLLNRVPACQGGSKGFTTVS